MCQRTFESCGQRCRWSRWSVLAFWPRNIAPRYQCICCARRGKMTQVHLAKILGVNQATVSKLERRADMYVSTLQSFVKAMGGELKITARFPEGTVEINQFEDVKKAAGE